MADVQGFDDTIAWYESNAQAYADKVADAANVELLEEFVGYVGAPGQGLKILDAGSGSGRDVKWFAQRGFEPTGIDLSYELVSVAQESFPELEFTQGNFLDLPFEDESFDGVWANASLSLPLYLFPQ